MFHVFSIKRYVFQSINLHIYTFVCNFFKPSPPPDTYYA